MLNMEILKNRPVSRETNACKFNVKFRSIWARKTFYVQLLELLPMARLYTQTWAIILAGSSASASASFSLLYQNWHADLEFACPFCFLADSAMFAAKIIIK